MSQLAKDILLGLSTLGVIVGLSMIVIAINAHTRDTLNRRMDGIEAKAVQTRIILDNWTDTLRANAYTVDSTGHIHRRGM